MEKQLNTPALSKINIQDTEFVVDFDLNELRQASKPSNKISFADLKYESLLEGFPVAFDIQTKKIHNLDDPAIAAKHTERLLIPDLLVLGRTDIIHTAIPLNAKTQTPDQLGEKLQKKYGFATVTLSNTEFLVDGPSRVLRQIGDRNNTISFDKLLYDSAKEGYSILYDRLNKNIYQGFVPKAGLPPMTERIVIPHMHAIENFRLVKPAKTLNTKKESTEVKRKSKGRKARM